MLRVLFVAFMLMMSASSPVMAQAQTVAGAEAPSSEPTMPKPLQERQANGAQVFYIGKYETLNGWVLIRDSQPEFYYATDDGKAIILGFLFDDKGTLLTGDQLKKLDLSARTGLGDIMASKMKPMAESAAPETAPAADAAPVKTDDAAAVAEAKPVEATPSAPAATAPAEAAPVTTLATPPADTAAPKMLSAAEKLMEDMTNAPGLTFGDVGKPTFYAFIDANCVHCQAFLKSVEPFVKAGTVAVRIIPVGFDDKSRRQGAFALASGDGAQRFVDHAKGADTLPAPAGLDVKAVRNNSALMNQWNLNLTPTILYKSGTSGQIKIIRGQPSDLPSVLIDLTGKQ